MSKWIKRIFLFIATLVIGLSSFGLSSWYFSKTQQVEDSINTDYKVDDIKENYRFGKADEEKRYTMYFFPSAAYMFLYGRYLEDTSTTYNLPEEEFGYKEVLTNESGNILTDKDGNALFKLSENTGKYQNDTTINSNTSYDGSYKLFINKHFKITNYTELNGKAGDGSIYKHSESIYHRTWGSPTDTLTYKGDEDEKDTIERYNGKNLSSLDRFGCWEDSYYYGNSGDENGANVTFIKDDNANSSNTGRYLPIKMTVSNSMSIDLLSKVIGDVFSSMGDKKHWYNFSFTNWTYVTKNTDNSYSFPYGWDNNGASTDNHNQVVNAFSAKDINRYFDVFENLENYADDNGVIRLFPMFSNGKTYDTTSYTNGGGDCFKIAADYKDVNKNNTYKYFMPSSERINNGSGNFSGTKIPNSNVRYYTYNYLKLSKNHNYNSLKINMTWTKNKPATWDGDWPNIYSFDNNYLTNELIKKYGDGLYNFYLFQGNFDHKSNDITYDDFFNKIKTEATGENGFNTLKGKSIEFIYLTDIIKNYEKRYQFWPPKMLYEYSPYNVSPVIFAIEKIVNPKIIDNVDIKGEGSNLTYESIDKLDDYIAQKSVNAHGFTRLSSPVYGRNEVGGTYNYSANSLNEKNPYTYIAKNVNFMNVKTNYFILAFSDVYISNVTIKIKSDNYSSVVVNPTISGTNFNYDPEDLFVNASEYIDRVTFSTGGTDKYGVLTFNNDDFKGVYDILLMFEGNNTFALYFYRHTNLFLKIFSNDLTTYQDNFLFHDETHITDADLIFKKKYFLGLTMNKDDINDMNKTEKQTLEQAITKYVLDKRGETYDLTNVRIIDHVTKTVVAKFNYIGGKYVLECNQRINKNYIFYLSMK